MLVPSPTANRVAQAMRTASCGETRECNGRQRVPSRAGPFPGSNEAKTEVVAGLTTFFTMAYIVVVNPSVLATAGTGMPFSGVLTATVLLSFFATLLMGLYARVPFAVAPGLGLNAFFAYTIVLGSDVPWPTALGMVFWAGLLFVLLSLSSIRVAIVDAIPPALRTATAVGIGLLLTFIGFRNAGLVVSDQSTFLKLGDLGPQTLLSLSGLLIMIWMMQRKNPLSFVAGIFFVTAMAGMLGYAKRPPSLVGWPDFSTVLKLDIWGALRPSFLAAIVTLFFTDLFDSLATFMGVAQASGMTDEKGHPPRLKQGLMVDAIATLGAGLLGTSSGTVYIESSAGIEVGGRTGLTSVVTALCFLPCLFLSPVAGMVPPFATAPVLILVGLLMFRSVSSLSFRRLEDDVPAFLTLVLIPLTSSITQGILWGFVSHVSLYVVVGRKDDVRPMMWLISAISLLLLVLEQSG